jgi:NAD+ kinase
MKTLVIYRRAPDKSTSLITTALQRAKIDYSVESQIGNEIPSSLDFLIVLGSDKDVLRAFQLLGPHRVPVLGVNKEEGGGFLTEISVGEFSQALNRILRHDFKIEETIRLAVRTDGQQLPPALNEVATFPSKSATFMEYLLSVDGEDVWRDYSDGVIITTPTGSTAYAMSAGGPMILAGADVLAVVPVNSADVTRRPLIIPNSSTIRLDEISSRYECEVVIDGTYRSKVRERVEISKYSIPAALIRLSTAYPTIDRLAKKVRLAEELLKMPASAKLVLKTLEYEGPLSQRELLKRTMLPERTARLALAMLLQKELVKMKTMPLDSRQKIYSVT